MRIWFFLCITLGILQASSISTKLLNTDGITGEIEASELKTGMSGFIVRHFDSSHSSIIANARVTHTQASSKRASIEISPYTGLRQNSLPSGHWTPKVGDEVIIAYDYTRAMLIAPNDDTYLSITANTPNVEWIHPDIYATYLSHEGHPTPLVEDFTRYCTSASIGLLFIQSAQTLFTLDCQNFALLQTVEYHAKGTEVLTPFYSRVPNIRAAWWGDGSSRLESYAPYYLQMMALSNPKNKELYQLYKDKFGEKSALLHHFTIKE